jgi:hypothetical protein
VTAGVGPLDVLRGGVERLDAAAHRSELDQLHVAQRELRADARHRVDAPTTARHRGHRLGAQGAFDHPSAVGDHVVVGLDLARDQGLAETVRGVDHHPVAPAVEGVGGEHHPRDVGGDELLHDDRERHVVVPDARTLAVPDGAGRPQRRPAVDHRGQRRRHRSR